MPPLDRQVRVCILYEFKLGNVANLAYLNVNRAFGEGTVSNAIVHRWFARFQEGDEDLDTEPTKEFDINDETIEEDPATVEALLSKQYGVPPGTLYTHLDRMGRGERLHELEPEDFGLPRAPHPSSAVRDPIGDGTSRIFSANGHVRIIPPIPKKEEIKLEIPDECPDDLTIRDVIKAKNHEERVLRKLHSAGSSTQNGDSCEYNKVRICDHGLEYRNTRNSSLPPEVRKIASRGSGVIARSLACLAKYRAENQELVKAPLVQGETMVKHRAENHDLKEPLVEVKPPPADDVCDKESVPKMPKVETVELPTEVSEMKEHIVPLF